MCIACQRCRMYGNICLHDTCHVFLYLLFLAVVLSLRVKEVERLKEHLVLKVEPIALEVVYNGLIIMSMPISVDLDFLVIGLGSMVTFVY